MAEHNTVVCSNDDCLKYHSFSTKDRKQCKTSSRSKNNTSYDATSYVSRGIFLIINIINSKYVLNIAEHFLSSVALKQESKPQYSRHYIQLIGKPMLCELEYKYKSGKLLRHSLKVPVLASQTWNISHKRLYSTHNKSLKIVENCILLCWKKTDYKMYFFKPQYEPKN